MNKIVPDNTMLGAGNPPKVEMPNRNGFISPDPMSQPAEFFRSFRATA